MGPTGPVTSWTVVRLRALLFLVPLLASEGSLATAGEPLGAVEVGAPTVVVVPALPPEAWAPEVPAAIGPSLPPEEEAALDPEPSGPPREVAWTVLQGEPRDLLASRWGLMERQLVALNPELRSVDYVPAGLSLRVFEHDDERPTRSIGAPNKGRLQHGLPMPEGPYWQLRERRTRTYGATNAIGAMVTAFTRYGQAFEGAAPPVSVGEISAPRGGRAHPHSSHRSGRDVDLGYIVLGDDDGDIRWRRMHRGNFDAEKNWYLIHEMIKTGNVETIFVSRKLQPLLYEEAKKELSPEALAEIFQHPRVEGVTSPVIRHWRGHHDHMHVRFRCEADNRRCRGERVEGS